MTDNKVAMLVVWMGKPTVGKLVQVCAAAASRILPRTAYENDEEFTYARGRLVANPRSPRLLNSYINKWDLTTVIPICGYDIFGDIITRAIEDGVVYEREQDCAVFEPLPLWEIEFLVGKEQYNAIIEDYNSAGWESGRG
jgi:hypothetical protein